MNNNNTLSTDLLNTSLFCLRVSSLPEPESRKSQILGGRTLRASCRKSSKHTKRRRGDWAISLMRSDVLHETRGHLNIKIVFSGTGIRIVKIRRSRDRFIFIMQIPIPENTLLRLRLVPVSLSPAYRMHRWPKWVAFNALCNSCSCARVYYPLVRWISLRNPQNIFEFLSFRHWTGR